MKELLIELLETFGYPVKLQGSLNEREAYPDTFFTFWNNESADNNHYDNDAVGWTWSYDVNVYSTNPQTVASLLSNAITLLKQNGFVISGKGHDLYSDEITHTGRGVTVLKYEHNFRAVQENNTEEIGG